ncbi:alpha/beta-hydrolase family protein [Shinella sp. CPCC 101442]|uniref:alpha/beta hydrolase n=1 Tax=Shinella sp. CPCC 101442 TaxID=2932265 RepID=UPI002152DEC5|nr:alpha/beta-hydrolase family protein [Shinella sp. CPCC 101442]MCR6500162.1 alpha/beta-hydrolase family protein [Shinella sp. CPCC 101442]
MRDRLWSFLLSFSAAGLVLGTLLFAASLTPSLLPRTYITQGLLSGVAMACGYGLGVLLSLLWFWLELPELRDRVRVWLKVAAGGVCGVVVLVFLWRTAEWQNSIRTLMNLPPIETAHPFYVGLIALAVFVVFIGLGRFFTLLVKLFANTSRRAAPRRLSYVIGTALAAILFWTLADGVLVRFVLHTADSSFRRLDQVIEPDTAEPSDPLKSGSAASLVRWNELGRMGRSFVASGPTATDISTFTGKPAMEPLRVYAGLNAGRTPGERAKIALDELIRVGGFERSTLVVIMPTGTGWVDPEGIDTVEYLHHGDIASIAIQYSYLASWLSLLAEPDYGAEAARALFRAVYGHWTSLPKERRPKLYLYGLSLGALSSEQSAELFEVIGDPYQGALWSGPPFPSRIWRKMTADRNPGTPAWLPRFRDGSYVRFTSQRNALPEAGDHWGPMRIVYLQYASDPITFYDPYAFYRQPAWMDTPRGPDVSPDFQWYPVVTFLQLTLDLAMATTTPMGLGHVYAGEHYVEPWIAVTGVTDWSAEDIARLKEKFRAGR